MSENKLNTVEKIMNYLIENERVKKKVIRIASLVCVLMIIACAVVSIGGCSGDTDTATDDEIDPAMLSDIQVNNYFGGIAEPQQTVEINKDPERTISNIYVKVGDAVKKGDKLFDYDSDEIENKLAKAQLEYTSIQNEISECSNRIATLTRERSQADENQQFDYTVQIQEQESTKEQAELNLKIKKVEIDNFQKSLDNSVVVSSIDGIIKKVNNQEDDSSSSFITILMSGSFRIKGSIDEMNIYSISNGQRVIIHSRTNDEKTWSGIISKIDVKNPDSNNEQGMMEQGDSVTKYSFYVTLDSSEGLLLGEHVYIEPLPMSEDMDTDEEIIDETFSDMSEAR